MTATTAPTYTGDLAMLRSTAANAESRWTAEFVAGGRHSSPSDSPSSSVEGFTQAIRDTLSDYTLAYSPSNSEQRNAIFIRHSQRHHKPETSDVFDTLLGRYATRAGWQWYGSAVSTSALINTLELEQNSLTFEPAAMAILGRIFDRGHATCDDLADWLESSEEWIAFSRLQRARLLYDSGTEFTVSPAGRRLIQDLLSEDDTK